MKNDDVEASNRHEHAALPIHEGAESSVLDSRHIIHYTVDGEEQQTRKRVLTPRQILLEAEINPEHYYLVQVIGHKQESYADKPDVPIRMHEHMIFVSVYRCETPVS